MSIKNWVKIAALSGALSLGYAEAEAQNVKQDKDAVKTEKVTAEQYIKALEEAAQEQTGEMKAAFLERANRVRTDPEFAKQTLREFNHYRDSINNEEANRTREKINSDFNKARREMHDEYDGFRKKSQDAFNDFRNGNESGFDALKEITSDTIEVSSSRIANIPSNKKQKIVPQKDTPEYERVQIKDKKKFSTNCIIIEDALNFKQLIDTRDGTNKIKSVSVARMVNSNKASIAASQLDQASTPEQIEAIMTKALDGVELVDGKPVYKGKIWENYDPNTNVGRASSTQRIKDYKPEKKKTMSASQFMNRLKKQR